MDLSLTCVISTQLWHHIYLGGGLCELPTWEAMSPRDRKPSSWISLFQTTRSRSPRRPAPDDTQPILPRWGYVLSRSGVIMATVAI